MKYSCSWVVNTLWVDRFFEDGLKVDGTYCNQVATKDAFIRDIVCPRTRPADLWNWYEVILDDQPCRFYLDIEVEVDDKKLTKLDDVLLGARLRWCHLSVSPGASYLPLRPTR